MTLAVLRLAWTEVLIGTRRPLNVATGVVSPLMFLALLLLPRLSSLQATETVEALSGVLLASLWSASLWSGASVVRRERAQGTLGTIVTGRLPPEIAILGKVLGTVGYDFTLIVATTALFVVVSGLNVHVDALGPYALGIALVFACGIATSFMFSGVLVLTRFGSQLTTAANTPVLLLGGTLIPYEALPPWVEVSGMLLNISWLQRFLVSCVSGQVAWMAALIAGVLSLAYLGLGIVCVRLLLMKARKDATLELV